MMRNYWQRYAVRVSIALITFASGIAIATFAFTLRQPQVKRPPCPQVEVKQQAERVSPPPVVYQPREKPKSMSPYDLWIYIDRNADHPDLQSIWRELGIKAELLKTCANCEAQLFDVELDGQPGREVLLRVTGWGEECRYLVFNQAGDPRKNSGWKLVGHIDSDFGRYRMPEHSILVGAGRSWLIINFQGASGSGVALFFNRVFEVTKTRIRDVLSFTSDGHQSDPVSDTGVTDRDFYADIINMERRGATEFMEIRFAASYYNDAGIMWGHNRKAVFVKGAKSKRFILNNSMSELSEHEIDAVFHIDSLSNEDLLRYNYADLIRIGTGKNAKQREWLRHFINLCEASPEKRNLAKLLRK
ncbi:MAG: hypothetical protein ACJ74W_03775 [Pyrinomonadaceae bacterium]